MTTAEMILAGRHQAGEDVDPMEAGDAALAAERRNAWTLIYETR